MSKEKEVIGPKIRTKIPGPISKNLLEELKRYTFASVPAGEWSGGVDIPLFEKAVGSIYLKDVDGNIWMDTHANWATMEHGYKADFIINAIKKQLDTLPSRTGRIHIELGKFLVEECAPGALKGNSRAMFDVGGSAALDQAIRIGLFYAAVTRKSRNRLLAFSGAYHGTATLGMFASDWPSFRKHFPTSLDVTRYPYPYCYRCPYRMEYPDCGVFCADIIEEQLESGSYGYWDPYTNVSDISTLVVEPIQSHGGVIVPPKEFYPKLRKICDKHDITFIDDEVCGFQLSGKYWFACEHYKTTPDIIATAKGFSAGYAPIGTLLVKNKIADVLKEEDFQYFTTYMAHPLSIASSLAGLKAVKKKHLLEHVEKMGAYALKRLKEIQESSEIVGDARGKGFMLALEFVKDKDTKEPFPEASIKMGYENTQRGITGASNWGLHRNVTHWHLPLCVSREEIDKFLEIVGESVKAVAKDLL